MRKLELLSRIDKIASIIHSDDVNHFSTAVVTELRMALDELTEEYISLYC